MGAPVSPTSTQCTVNILGLCLHATTTDVCVSSSTTSYMKPRRIRNGCSRGCQPRNCDTDIRELRAQICDLRSLSAAVSSILKRHQGLDIVPEHEVLVNSALVECEDAAKALRAVTERLTVDGISNRDDRAVGPGLRWSR
ncbi:hypothetical protein KC350_g2 [Hortaea werneckii]|nr:hypothetical protein KC350_g2 [Hortaea werneckii]